MSGFSSAEYGFMAEAIRLAGNGTYTCHPNPRVGCVLVRDGRVIGRGWHRKAGDAHAEINAINDCEADTRGATAFVTLEPCSHQGKTPPCADALVAAGIGEVIAAGNDPNPKVAGKGFGALQKAGIKVRTGLMQGAAEKLNEGFFSRVVRGRPFVRLKIACSLDGRTAMSGGESQWISAAGARADVQKLRAASGAVLTGIATVLADNPSLTVRDERIDNDGLQPLRAILDSQLRIPPGANVLGRNGNAVIFCICDDRPTELRDAGAHIEVMPAKDGRVDLHTVLRNLGERRINDLLVEAGPTLSGSFLTAGLVDELVIYQAPHIMGSNTRGMFTTPGWSELSQRMSMTILDTRQVGPDFRIIARPVG
jgi:diaminohydroxyphosphoribosylaminopyrimidine deaminase/5-amino-6-(5-phosphoribosylamino)uracil reductase